jgi:hypothetical protein
MSRALLVVTNLAVVGSAWAAGTLAETALLAQLSQARPNIRWDASSEITGDFDGDGTPDSALIGYGSKQVIVATVTSSNKVSHVQYLEVPIGNTQDAICSVPAKLTTYPLSCKTDSGQRLPGCLESRNVVGLALNDDNCDPINLYWDHDKHRLNWWRN